MGTVSEAGGVEARPASLGVQGKRAKEARSGGAGGPSGTADSEKMERDPTTWDGSEDRGKWGWGGVEKRGCLCHPVWAVLRP